MSDHFTKLHRFDKRFERAWKKKHTDIEVAKPRSLRGQLFLFANAGTGVIGVDEVGRGCLAGPVIAAAVMLPKLEKGSALATELEKLNDSKQLTARQRERLAKTIHSCSWTAIGSASPEEIDKINILQATLLSMKRAVEKLQNLLPAAYTNPTILVDGTRVADGMPGEVHTVPKGDTKSAAIAAASVVAKVYRDQLITELAADYPEYHWEKNKGYPSKQHRKALYKLGPTIWHRQSFSCEQVPDDE